MKRKRLFTILVCLCIVVGGILAVVAPRIVPFWQTSDIYQKYAYAEGIAATFVRDFPLYDSTLVDVTLLEAADSSHWGRLLADFRSRDTDSPSDGRDSIRKIKVYFVPRKDASLPMDTCLLNNDLVVISFSSRQLAVFHVKSYRQIESVFDYQIRKLKE